MNLPSAILLILAFIVLGVGFLIFKWGGPMIGERDDRVSADEYLNRYAEQERERNGID